MINISLNIVLLTIFVPFTYAVTNSCPAFVWPTGSCPADGDWLTTKAGHIARQPCDIGEIRRQCHNDGTWASIDVSLCYAYPERQCADGRQCLFGAQCQLSAGQRSCMCPIGYVPTLYESLPYKKCELGAGRVGSSCKNGELCTDGAQCVLGECVCAEPRPLKLYDNERKDYICSKRRFSSYIFFSFDN